MYKNILPEEAKFETLLSNKYPWISKSDINRVSHNLYAELYDNTVVPSIKEYLATLRGTIQKELIELKLSDDVDEVYEILRDSAMKLAECYLTSNCTFSKGEKSYVCNHLGNRRQIT